MMNEFSFSTTIKSETRKLNLAPENSVEKFSNSLIYDKMPHSKRKELLIYLVRRGGRKLITFSYVADLFVKLGIGSGNGKNLLMRLFHDNDFIVIEDQNALMLYEHLFFSENQDKNKITFNSLCLALED